MVNIMCFWNFYLDQFSSPKVEWGSSLITHLVPYEPVQKVHQTGSSGLNSVLLMQSLLNSRILLLYVADIQFFHLYNLSSGSMHFKLSLMSTGVKYSTVSPAGEVQPLLGLETAAAQWCRDWGRNSDSSSSSQLQCGYLGIQGYN